jgi:hypothetical protein
LEIANVNGKNCQDFWIGDDGVDYTRLYEIPPEGEALALYDGFELISHRMEGLSAKNGNVYTWQRRDGLPASQWGRGIIMHMGKPGCYSVVRCRFRSRRSSSIMAVFTSIVEEIVVVDRVHAAAASRVVTAVWSLVPYRT